LQSGNNTKRVALDVVQNLTEWWTFRQSEPERRRRAQETAAKLVREQEKKLEQLRKIESLKEKNQAQMDQKAADKLRKAEQEQERKQLKAEMNAEKQRVKEAELARKHLEKEQIEVERRRKIDEEMALKRSKSAEKKLEKERKRLQDLEMKRFRSEEKERKKQILSEEKDNADDDAQAESIEEEKLDSTKINGKSAASSIDEPLAQEVDNSHQDEVSPESSSESASETEVAQAFDGSV